MEVRWEKELLKVSKEIMIRGGSVEFIVYKRQNKRKPIIRKYPENEIHCKEEEIID